MRKSGVGWTHERGRFPDLNLLFCACFGGLQRRQLRTAQDSTLFMWRGGTADRDLASIHSLQRKMCTHTCVWVCVSRNSRCYLCSYRTLIFSNNTTYMWFWCHRKNVSFTTLSLYLYCILCMFSWVKVLRWETHSKMSTTKGEQSQ